MDTRYPRDTAKRKLREYESQKAEQAWRSRERRGRALDVSMAVLAAAVILGCTFALVHVGCLAWQSWATIPKMVPATDPRPAPGKSYDDIVLHDETGK